MQVKKNVTVGGKSKTYRVYYSILWKEVQLCGHSNARESITGESWTGGGGAVAKARKGKRRGRRDNDGTAS